MTSVVCFVQLKLRKDNEVRYNGDNQWQGTFLLNLYKRHTQDTSAFEQGQSKH